MPIGIADIIAILLVTIGPLKALIIYATLTSGADAALRRQIAIRTVVVATIVSLLFVVAGEVLLMLFHISLAALKIAGGIILLLFALGMVMGGGHDDEDKPKAVTLSIAVYPLAMPMMATPQGLVAITALTAGATNFGQVIAIAVIVVAIMGVNLICLLSADRIIKALGPSTLQIVGKIAGLLLTALAVQLMILGLTDLGLIAKTAH